MLLNKNHTMQSFGNVGVENWEGVNKVYEELIFTDSPNDNAIKIWNYIDAGYIVYFVQAGDYI